MQSKSNNNNNNSGGSSARRPFSRPSSSRGGEEPVKKKLKFGARRMVTFLLPNGVTLKMQLEQGQFSDLDDLFTELEQRELGSAGDQGFRRVDWRSPSLGLEDVLGNRLQDMKDIRLSCDEDVFLIQDGVEPTQHNEKQLWNVTPAPELLDRLPDGYTFDTALADHVDNALQAVWGSKNRKLVSVEIQNDSIVIFDTGSGMDATEAKSIARWGTVGASSSRDLQAQAVGGEPPFLKPYFGKYGVGGVSAALYLGRHVEVRSKTKDTKKVVSLKLGKDEIIENQQGSRIWRTKGGFHDMTEEERKKSPHGSFTSVKITGLNVDACTEGRYWKVAQLRKQLKDIYSLYIQSERGGMTLTSVEFEVNGKNLLEELGGEITSCNKHSCPGERFILDVHFVIEMKDTNGRPSRREANGRLTCQYFPNKKGKETLEAVIEELNFPGSFESFPRVRVRWLGRLLPQEHWDKIPFMYVIKGRDQQKKDQERWVKRVKVFADLDAGFSPTPTKTKLSDDTFARALQHLGLFDTNKHSDLADVKVEIRYNGKSLSISELSAAFQNWVKEMHEHFDEEVDFEGETYYVINDQRQYKKTLGAENQVLTFHRHLKDSSGHFGAFKAGDHFDMKKPGDRQHTYGEIEWFFCDGTDDQRSSAKVIYRPVTVLLPEGKTEESELKTVRGTCQFELNKCKYYSVHDLTSGYCSRMSLEEWNKQVERVGKKSPASIQLLSNDDRKQLGQEPFMSSGKTIEAGCILGAPFLVVVRPRQGIGASYKQGMIFQAERFMTMEVLLKEAFTNEETSLSSVSSSSISMPGVKGIFSFPFEKPLKKAGRYTFRFTWEDLGPLTWTVTIKPLEVSKFVLRTTESECFNVRLEEASQTPLMLEQVDKFGNYVCFDRSVHLKLTLENPPRNELMSVNLKRDNVTLSPDQKTVIVKDFTIPSCPAGLCFVCLSELPRGKRAAMNCLAKPGKVASIRMTECSLSWDFDPPSIKEPLEPENDLQLAFEAKDRYGNLVTEGTITVKFILDGRDVLTLPEKEVDANGYLRLTDVEVPKAYNKTGQVALFSEDGRKVFQINCCYPIRKLKLESQLPKRAWLGQVFDGLKLSVLDFDGNRDTSMGGAIAVDWEESILFKLEHGSCLMRMEMPKVPGTWKARLWHSTYVDLQLQFEMQVEMADACKLCHAEEHFDQMIKCQCQEMFSVMFEARDERDLPSVLDKEAADKLLVRVTPEESSLAWEAEEVLESKEIVNVEGALHTLNVRLNGKQGFYKLTLSVEDVSTISWRVQLGPGPVAQLVPILLNDDGHDSDKLWKALRNGLETPSVQQRGLFPEFRVYIVDSKGNTCDRYDGAEVSLELQGCIKVKNGSAHSLPFPVDLPIGTHEMKLVLVVDNICKMASSFQFNVKPENFPARLRLLTEIPSVIVLTDGEKTYFPVIRLVVESEDGLQLQHCSRALLSICEDSAGASLNFKREEESEHEGGSVFKFGGVTVPGKCGDYTLKFFLSDYLKVEPLSVLVQVQHGEPNRLKLYELEENWVSVKIEDRNGNQCVRLTDICVVGHFVSQADATNRLDISGTVSEGRVDFEAELEPGRYDLTVSFDDLHIPLMKTIITVTTTYSMNQSQALTIVPQPNPLLVETHRNMTRQLERMRMRVGTYTDTLQRSSLKEMNILRLQQSQHDEDVLNQEQNEPEITERHLLSMLAEKDPLMFRLIHSKPPGCPGEILNLVVRLARVETEQLNNALSNYLGPKKLAALVCKSRRALQWLNADSNDVGLCAFANKLLLQVEELNVIILDEIKINGNILVDDAHSQRLLKLHSPALVSGETPPGFLGYAVNLIHLTSRCLHFRPTLFYELLGNLQVYDTRKNMLSAQEQLQDPGFEGVSLDGARSSRSMKTFGSNRRPSLCFASVPFGERLKCSLVHPAASAFERRRQLLNVRSEIASQREKYAHATKCMLELEQWIKTLEEKIEASIPKGR